MDVASYVGRLAALVGVSEQERNWYDWRAIESSLGLRLPDDYKRLVTTFPDGVFQGVVQLNRPGDSHHPASEYLGFYAYRLDDMRALREGGHAFPYPIFPEPGGLLPWASGRRLEPFFWVTGAAEDPNGWPIVVTDYDFEQWREFPGPACEFLIAVVEGRFDGAPFGFDVTAGGPSFEPAEVPELDPRPSRPFWTTQGRAVGEFPALAEILGPPPVAVPPVNWAEIEEFMGVGLPSDYRTFVDTYGPGTYGDIRIAAPGGPGELDLYKLLARAYNDARAPGAPGAIPVCPEPDGMIAWGDRAGGWYFSWMPSAPDPDRWGVAFGTVRGLLSHLPEESFSRFLRRYAEGAEDLTELLELPAASAQPRFTPARA